MSEESYRFIKGKRDGLSITFEFPCKTEHEEHIKAEIKDIFCNILNEYLVSIPQQTDRK